MQLEQKISKILISQKKTMSVAESCTGGLLSNALTNVPGSSAFFLLGVIAYDNAAKTNVLKVPPRYITTHGAVSAEVASFMAHGVRNILKTDIGIGITGIAGPTGGKKYKPVGTTFIAVCLGKKTTVQQFHFKGNRSQNKTFAKNTALKILQGMLMQDIKI